ncbi:transcription and mRNA export factor ENY2 isoform X1 [Clinocottus analis]|uniref:transcription and mRNA export factor ENY2 isoform X1 n=1 Tax=Clinocottus analis TaxID=304258 RepID=UPI0035BFDE92
MTKESKIRATVNQKLTEMGERERLKELLRAKLTECGWKDQMKAHCKEVIKDKGLEQVTVEDLVVEITPIGRGHLTSSRAVLISPAKALVPDSVKKELLHRITAFFAQHAT